MLSNSFVRTLLLAALCFQVTTLRCSWPHCDTPEGRFPIMDSELWFPKICSWFTADMAALGYRDTVITRHRQCCFSEDKTRALNADRPAHQQAGNGQLQAPTALPWGKFSHATTHLRAGIPQSV